MAPIMEDHGTQHFQGYQHDNPDEPDIMTWFPRREDYDDKPAVLPDESYEEKIQRQRYSSSSSLILRVIWRGHLILVFSISWVYSLVISKRQVLLKAFCHILCQFFFWLKYYLHGWDFANFSVQHLCSHSGVHRIQL